MNNIFNWIHNTIIPASSLRLCLPLQPPSNYNCSFDFMCDFVSGEMNKPEKLTNCFFLCMWFVGNNAIYNTAVSKRKKKKYCSVIIWRWQMSQVWYYQLNGIYGSGHGNLFLENTWEESVKLSGVILGLCPANERQRYFVTLSLIGWVQT